MNVIVFSYPLTAKNGIKRHSRFPRFFDNDEEATRLIHETERCFGKAEATKIFRGLDPNMNREDVIARIRSGKDL